MLEKVQEGGSGREETNQLVSFLPLTLVSFSPNQTGFFSTMINPSSYLTLTYFMIYHHLFHLYN